MNMRCANPVGRGAVVLTVATLLAPFAAAQSDGDLPPWHPLHPDRVADVREAPMPAMSENFYKRLARIHELLEEDKGQEALGLLGRIRPDRIAEYEAAQFYQTLGYAHSQLGREDDAFEAFVQCMELDMLPTSQQQSIVYSVASQYASRERYDESNETLLRWFRHEPKPRAEAYVVIAANFAQSDRMADALPYVLRANELADQPNENWRNLQLAIHVDLRQLQDAIALLKDNIAIWPDDVRHYIALAGIYSEAGEDPRALATLSIPWQRGMLVASEAILNLVRLNVFLETPARGAAILSEAMSLGHVEEDTTNLRLLLNAWMLARENNRAVDTIDKLAALADDGEYYRQKALILNETGDWDLVVESCQQALDKGGLENPGEVWLLQGVAHAELEQFDLAIDAFENAKRSGTDNIRRDANSWIGYVEERKGPS